MKRSVLIIAVLLVVVLGAVLLVPKLNITVSIAIARAPEKQDMEVRKVGLDQLINRVVVKQACAWDPETRTLYWVDRFPVSPPDQDNWKVAELFKGDPGKIDPAIKETMEAYLALPVGAKFTYSQNQVYADGEGNGHFFRGYFWPADQETANNLKNMLAAK